jgi:hypothetical protein
MELSLAILNQNSPTFDADLASIKKTNPNAQTGNIPDFKKIYSQPLLILSLMQRLMQFLTGLI